jgi:hypothetical protein
MNPAEVLYTPLDTPNAPNIDIEKLKTWIDSHQSYNSKYDAGSIMPSDVFPWKVSYIKESNKWCNNFNVEFPELAEYVSSAYGLQPDDIVTGIFAYAKSDFEGMGFWHSDVDSSGLRMYIQNEETDDFLFIKPTTQPFNDFPTDRLKGGNSEISLMDGSFQIQTDIIHSAKLLKPTQCFYLNSVRGVHAIKTNKKGCTRILLALTLDLSIGIQNLPEQLKKLIVNSAQKYKDYAIMWTPPINK